MRFPLTPGIKRYPSGGLGHTAIDAALELRPMVPLSEIAGVEVAITKFASRRYTTTYPQSTEAAKFSAPYLAAYTLIHGAPMVAAFTEEALHDEAVRTLATTVVKPDAAKKIFAMLGALGEQKSFDEFSPEQRPGLA